MHCCKVVESGEYTSFAPPMHYTHLVKIWDCDYLYTPFFFTYYKWQGTCHRSKSTMNMARVY